MRRQIMLRACEWFDYLHLYGCLANWDKWVGMNDEVCVDQVKTTSFVSEYKTRSGNSTITIIDGKKETAMGLPKPQRTSHLVTKR